MIEFAFQQMTGRRAAQEDALDILALDGAVVGDVERRASAGMASQDGTASAEADDVDASAGRFCVPLDTGAVIVVADGMGGHVGGRIASTISVKAFLESVRASSASWDARLEAGLKAANAALRQEAERRPDLSGMGSTLVGAVVSETGLGWISIGDSALYHYRAGCLSRLNEDHSFGAYLDQQARDGLMSAEAAAGDRRRNHLFYALLGDELEHYERFSGFYGLISGDIILVASDGLKTLPDERIAAIIAENGMGPVDRLVDALLSAIETEDRERQDNVSVIAARIAEPTSAGAPDNTSAAADRREAPTAAKTLPQTAHRPRIDALPVPPVVGPGTEGQAAKAKRPASARLWLAVIVLVVVISAVAFVAAKLLT